MKGDGRGRVAAQFGWCLDGNHHKCPGRIWSNGSMSWIECGCEHPDCHNGAGRQLDIFDALNERNTP